MRNLKRNKTHFVALNYVGKTEVKDSQGYKTGEYIVKYSCEIHLKAHISGAKGNAYTEIFGTDVAYDKTIVITRKELEHYGFTENTVFFIDKAPEYSEGDIPLYDYKVERIAKTLNEVVIAVSQVRNEN